MGSGPWRAQLRPNFPGNLLPTPGDLPGRVCQVFAPTPPLARFPCSQRTPGPPFWKDQLLPSLPVPFPSEGHVRAEMEGLREGPLGTLGLWLGPYPHSLHPCPPPPAHSSLAEVSPSGTGEPPHHQPHHSSSLTPVFFIAQHGGRGWGERRGGWEWGLPLPSFSIAREGVGRRCQECCRSRLRWHSTH